jgi:CubicO group peptidase (beta-lactamase class C family)
MQLHERKLLNVSDYIDKYLPDYPNGDKISIHHLLTHTSGIFNYAATLEFWQSEMRLFSPSLNDVIDLFKNIPLGFNPGERFSYSNSGYILLTAIIEKISGLTYGKYLNEYILFPIGMKNTGYDDGRTILKNLASGYSVWKDMIHPEREDMSNTLGAYGLYSTVEDLYLWDRALYTENIISFDSLQKIFTAHHDQYGGYGLHVTQQNILGSSRCRVGHLGDISGYIANFIRFPNDDLVVIVLSNMSFTPVERISEDLARIVLGEVIHSPKLFEPLVLSEEKSNTFIGTYGESDNKSEWILITKDCGKLYIEMSQRYGVLYKYEIIPIAATENSTEFITKMVDEKVHFKFDIETEIIHLQYWDIDGHNAILKKC